MKSGIKNGAGLVRRSSKSEGGDGQGLEGDSEEDRSMKEHPNSLPYEWESNMIIHDMEGQIEMSYTFKNPKFRDKSGKLRTFDRVVA